MVQSSQHLKEYADLSGETGRKVFYMNTNEMIAKMIKVVGCEFTPAHDGESAYISIAVEFPKGVQLFTAADADNVLTVCVNV